MEWRTVVEESGVRGAPRMVLGFLASRAEVCLAAASLGQVVEFSGYSRSHALRAIRELRRTENAVWLNGDEAFAEGGTRRYHLPKACAAGSLCEQYVNRQGAAFSGDCRQVSPAASLRGRGMPQLREKDDPEGCLLCRGTRWKLVPRRDGAAGNVAIRCWAHVKQLQLVELPEMSWAPAITEQQLWWRSNQLRGGARPDGFRLEP